MKFKNPATAWGFPLAIGVGVAQPLVVGEYEVVAFIDGKEAGFVRIAISESDDD
ncbi:MAG: hypothetical protein IPH13_20885 [Planctomycetes bacterium]|nr:hypothetical protein [Planctomycetota bacterium]